MDEPSSRGRRASMVELILSILANSPKPLHATTIRQRIALPDLWQHEQLSVGQLGQSRRWLCLHLRQLQRLALESLMAWLEAELLTNGHQTPNHLVDTATGQIAEALDFEDNTTTLEALDFVGSAFGDLKSFQDKVVEDPEWFSPWSLCEELEDAVRDEHETALTSGFYSLLLLYQCRGFLENDELLLKHLEMGGAARISLAHWFRTVDRFLERPVADLIDWVLKNMIISQHLAVGTQRFDGQKIRLRMILEEDGLESLVGWSWQPGVTPDRLVALLSLLSSCGVVSRTSEDLFAINSQTSG